MKTAVSQADSVHVSGSGTDKGQSFRLDMDFTKAGDVAGTITSGSASFYIIVTGGKGYIKVSSAFLKANGAPASLCPQICGKYIAVSGSDVASMTGTLSMSALFDNAFKNLNANGMQVTGKQTVNGQSAWVLKASDGTGYIAADGKPYLLRLTSTGSGAGTLNFTQWNAVTPPAAPPASQIIDLSKLGG